jgi:glycosyltransferase involved in cell wall biosynthesis
LTFSVVIPAHNTGVFLKEALESVRAQTFQDFEVIIVDDASTDDTWAVVQSCQEWFPGRYRGIRIEPPRNKGPAGARNLALRQAQGEYVAFLDSDDVWVPEHLARADAAFSRAGSQAGLFAGLGQWLGGAGMSHDYVSAGFKWPSSEPQPASPELLRWCYFPLPSVCIRRGLVLEMNGFVESLVCWEDWVLYLGLSRRTLFLHSPLVECLIRRRQASVTAAGNLMSRAQYRDRIRAWLLLARSGEWNRDDLRFMRQYFVHGTANELADHLCSFHRANAMHVIRALLSSGPAGAGTWLPILFRAWRQFLVRGLRKATRLNS